jgi:hemerythrin-like domain-containing protein
MRITEALHAEHATLYAQLDFLAEVAGSSPDAAEARVYAALLGAALHSHAELEDELLFDTLETQIGPIGPIAVMRAEHEEVKSTLDRLEQLPAGEDPAPLLQHLVDVAREHFDKEEQVLFPMAENVLPQADLEAAARRWAERRFSSTWARL